MGPRCGAIDSRREFGGESICGLSGIPKLIGDEMLELGGLSFELPRRMRHVGQSFTNREMSSFGTLQFGQ